jgi:hypothetical protein
VPSRDLVPGTPLPGLPQPAPKVGRPRA